MTQGLPRFSSCGHRPAGLYRTDEHAMASLRVGYRKTPRLRFFSLKILPGVRGLAPAPTTATCALGGAA